MKTDTGTHTGLIQIRIRLRIRASYGPHTDTDTHTVRALYTFSSTRNHVLFIYYYATERSK